MMRLTIGNHSYEGSVRDCWLWVKRDITCRLRGHVSVDGSTYLSTEEGMVQRKHVYTTCKRCHKTLMSRIEGGEPIQFYPYKGGHGWMSEEP